MAPRNKASNTNRKTKVFIAFDENNRKNFLTGFRKRKKERQNKAKKMLEEKLKKERREIRKEKRELFKTMARESAIPEEIKHLLDPKVYDLDNHTVTVTDISEVDLSGQDGLRLGVNKALRDEKEPAETLTDPSEENTDEKVKNKKIFEEKLRNRIKKANDLQQRLKAKQKKKHVPRSDLDPKSRKDKMFQRKKK
ncbi:nucleolar protein 12 [Octopus bimaculoides]|uniref:Nucleolar protein 12 n=1 Tax=Octopus bimaculoides TaxID=37653 RepID=A0A0L8IF65_OCTBM|nr:nucleolar protein 12 [Octopus bimaculoides]|eukprot:XP_014770691.1 PREDICTED: nucleolar protein 12-like [Octopus bimaculoides]